MITFVVDVKDLIVLFHVGLKETCFQIKCYIKKVNRFGVRNHLDF